MAKEGKRVENTPTVPFNIDGIKNNSAIKEYGAVYLYKQVAQKIGLLDILKKWSPDKWEAVFNLCCFDISQGEAFMYCEDRLAKSGCENAKLTSSSISSLLGSINEAEQNRFYNMWAKERSEKEYLALDITSVSSYSKLINECEWGYNRDGEKLPQVNLCMLLGEKTRLPVYQTLYAGSLKDVSTLKTTLSLAFSLGKKRLTLVMDKGFYSRNNVETLLGGDLNSNFIISIPLKNNIVKEKIEKCKAEIDRPENSIIIGKERVRAMTVTEKQDNRSVVYYHVYYNTVKAARLKNDLYGYVSYLLEMAHQNPCDKNYKDDFDKYLLITKDKTGKYQIEINNAKIAAQIYFSGWMVLMSNHIKNSKEALQIYRSKDVVEKGFFRLKNNLDLNRLRIDTDTNMRSKTFIAFLSLIIVSAIHNTMTVKKLYKQMTLKELIRKMEQLRVQYISSARIVFPLTKIQKTILDAFGFDYPV
jgi:transposase